MQHQTDDLRIVETKEVIAPSELEKELPISEQSPRCQKHDCQSEIEVRAPPDPVPVHPASQ